MQKPVERNFFSGRMNFIFLLAFSLVSGFWFHTTLQNTHNITNVQTYNHPSEMTNNNTNLLETLPRKSVILYLDAEPDDLETMLALAVRDLLSLVMIGRGTAKDLLHKSIIVSEILRSLGSDAPIALDTPNESDGGNYPGEDALANVFDITGKDAPEVLVSHVAFREEITKPRCRVVVCTAPPEAIVRLWPESLRALKKRKLFVTGSFNFREMGDRKGDMLDVFSFFDETHVFQTYDAYGERNSANRRNFPELFKAPAATPTALRISELIHRVRVAWDTYINVDAYDTCVSISPRYGFVPPEARDKYVEDYKKSSEQEKEGKTADEQAQIDRRVNRFLRNHKAAVSTQARDGNQGVFADEGVILMMSGRIAQFGDSVFLGFTPSNYTFVIDDIFNHDGAFARVVLYRDIGIPKAMRTDMAARRKANAEAGTVDRLLDQRLEAGVDTYVSVRNWCFCNPRPSEALNNKL